MIGVAPRARPCARLTSHNSRWSSARLASGRPPRAAFEKPRIPNSWGALAAGTWRLGHGGGRLVNNSHASIEAVYPDYGFTHRIYAIDVQGVLERSVI